MPKIWLANVEEVFSPRSHDDDWTLIPKTDAMAPRFLFYAEPGDVMLLSCEVTRSFAKFVGQVGGFQHEPMRVLAPSCPVSPYSLVDSVLEDEQLLKELRGLVCLGQWRLEPYIETPGAIRLGETLGIPVGHTPPDKVREGLIERLNDKGFCKNLAVDLGIPTVPGWLVEGRSEVEKALADLRQTTPDRIMLRKVQSGGGLGNLAGSYAELVFMLPDFYHGGGVIVEPWLNFSETLGSLVEIRDDGLQYVGIDSQVFEEGAWVGFRYPSRASAMDEQVREHSLKVAEAARAMGARGYLNMDWGVTTGADGNKKCLILECNFRHNGLSHILDYAHRYFSGREKEKHMLFLENFRLGRSGMSWNEVREALAMLRYDDEDVLISRPGQEFGLLPVMPPQQDTCGLVVFGRSAEEVEVLLKKGRAALE